MKIIKKLGMCSVYFFVGYVVNYFATMFGLGNRNGGNGYAPIPIILMGAAICWISYYLRVGKLKKEHKGDESAEKRIFNSDLKSKIKYVINTSDFKIESVIHVFVAIIAIMIPLIPFASYYGFSAIFSNPRNIIIVVLWIIIVPIYMAFVNATSWILAYNKCYSRKEFN